MTGPTQAQLDDFARRLRALEAEFEALTRQARGAATSVLPPPVVPPAPEMPPAPIWPPPPATPPRAKPAPQQQPPSPIWPPPPASTQPRPPRKPLFTLPRLPKFEPSDLLGARALAVAGGVVMLLGIVFFFVLAVNRGWVGPLGRVALGGGAALFVFAGGLELRRRYGDTYSSLAAVGTGIAGGYATLLSAAALYNLLPDYAALAVAAAIASVAVATSIAWRSQHVAGLGLLGAMLVPVAVVAQGGLSPLGTAFAAVVFAATAVVAAWLQWRELLVAGVVVSVPQIALLVFQADYHAQSPWRIVLLAAVFSLLYVAAGVGNHLRADRAGLGALTTSLTFGGGILAALFMVRLFDTPRDDGFALLAVAVVYGLAASLFFAREASRDLSALLAAAAFTFGAFAVADVLDGRPLAYAWAAEAAAVAWLARRVRELRFQIWSGVYLVLTLVHVLALDAPPSRLFIPSADPASGAPAAAAFAAAASVFAFYARPWAGPQARLFAFVQAHQRLLRSVSLWSAGIVATFAASLGILALFSSFDWGWVAVTGLWSLVGLGLLVVSPHRNGPLAWLAVAGTVVVLQCVESLAEPPRSWALLVLAAALFIAGVLDVKRNTSTYLATAAIVVGAFAAAGLLSGEPLAYAWAVEAAALALIARRLKAPHLQALALAPLGLALVHVVAYDAPPRQLLVDVVHPWHGALTALAFAAAAGVCATQTRSWRAPLLWAAGLAATYTLSLGTLEVFSSFDWGYVALAALWSAIGLGVLLAGLRVEAIAWLAATTWLIAAEGFVLLTPTPRSAAFLVVSAALLAAGLVYALRDRRAALEPVAAAGTLLSLALSWYAIAAPLNGHREGAALLALALVYGAVSAGLFAVTRLRDLTTLFWAIALVLAGVANAQLLDGTYAVLAWAAVGAAVAWLSARTSERRFLIGAGAYVAVALAHAVALEAPPTDLFVARMHPAAGAPAILIVGAAVAALGYFLHRGRKEAWALAGVLAVYGLSLSILELVASIFNQGLQTEFQRGHTGVSAFWGLLGLALLYAGLKRWRSLRLAGFALFAVSLGKIFIYDLPSLSSITRALSFLAVGAVLLLGGFFYQHLSAVDEPNGATS